MSSAQRPECDVREYMQPVWSGRTVFDEAVLLVSEHGADPAGRLLFTPTEILSVRDASLHKVYHEGRDYRVEGRTLVAAEGSTMPTISDSSFPIEPLPWLSVSGQHVLVTYTHNDVWVGPAPRSQVERLPRTILCLETKQSLKVVALGDSITEGMDVSGYRKAPPFMPSWVELFALGLNAMFPGTEVEMLNAGLGGMTAKWGEDNAHDLVAVHRPNLALIAFGMNDFWSVEPDAFGVSIRATILTIQAVSPATEFILISSIGFDPAYTSDADYTGRMKGYRDVLTSMAGPGVAVLDMDTLSAFLYEAKGAKSLLADPMHPNDFLARIYAQSLVAMLTR